MIQLEECNLEEESRQQDVSTHIPVATPTDLETYIEAFSLLVRENTEC